MLETNVTKAGGKKLLGHCVPGCVDYEFDHSFWVATMITEWDLVCENSWLKTLAKLLLFTGETGIYYHLIYCEDDIV